MKPARMELSIDELVLHGFAPGDQRSISEAVRRELTRLAAGQGFPRELTKRGAIGRLDAGTIQDDPVRRPDRIGAQVAQSVFGAIGKASMKGKR